MSDERRALNLQMAEDIGYIKGKLDSLCGPEGRITKIEQSQERHWWFSVAIGPALAIAHSIARKFGVTV